MTSTLNIPVTQVPGSEILSKNQNWEQDQVDLPFSNQIRELSSMYISKCLISIFCF